MGGGSAVADNVSKDVGKILHIGQHLRKSCQAIVLMRIAAGCCWVLTSALAVWCKALACLPACRMARHQLCVLQRAFGAPVNCRGCWGGASRGFAAMGVQARASHTNIHIHMHANTNISPGGKRSEKAENVQAGPRPIVEYAEKNLINSAVHLTSPHLTSPHLTSHQPINPIQKGCFFTAFLPDW